MDEQVRNQRATVGAVGVGAALVVVVRLSLADSPVRTLWAEDGAVFLQDAVRHPVSSLASSYAGYGQIEPRVLGELGHVVPIMSWPTLVLVSTAIMIGLTSAVVFQAARALDLGVLPAVVGALTPAALPGLGVEVLGAWANLQWVLAYGLAWVLLVPPARSGRVVPAVFAFLALGGGIASVFVSPLILLHGRRWYRHPAAPGLAVAALYQLVVWFSPSVSLARHRSAAFFDRTRRELIRAPARALVDSGGGLLTHRVFSYGGALLLVAMIVAVACSRRRRMGLAVIACAFVALVVLSVLNHGLVAGRYATLASSLVVASFLLCWGTREPRRRWFPWALALLCLPWAFSLPVSPYRASGPSWDAAIERARARCESGRSTGSTIVRVPVAPTVWARTAKLPCDVVG